jgi:hypothetical protein
VDNEVMKEHFTSRLGVSQFNEGLFTQSDLQNFLHQFKVFNAAYHRPLSQANTERVWFDLIQGRKSKNIFILNAPFLLRIVSTRYTFSGIPAESVLIMNDMFFESRHIPADHDPDQCVGLYSSRISLILTNVPDEHFPSVNTELWPDIQQPLQSLKPPGCYVDFCYTHVTFVSTASEKEIQSMWGAEVVESTVGARARGWWKGVHDYMQKVLDGSP